MSPIRAMCALLATMLCLANNLARGYAGVRPQLVERILARLDSEDLPTIRLYGAKPGKA